MPNTVIKAATGSELPLTPVKREKMENDLLRWLTVNNCVAGGLMFCARNGKFECVKLTRDVEDLMPQHVNTLRTKSRDLGKRRAETMPIHHKDSLGPSYARVFARVLKGCTEAQIAGALEHLNDMMSGCPTEQMFSRYDEMATLCRDVLVPGFKMFTRTTKYKPWSWFPIINTSPIVCLSDVVVGGDKTKGVDVTEEMAANKSGYPRIELVPKESHEVGVPSTSGTLVRTVHDNKVHSLDGDKGSKLSKLDDGKQINPEDSMFPDDDDVLLAEVGDATNENKSEDQEAVPAKAPTSAQSEAPVIAAPKVDGKSVAKDDGDRKESQDSDTNAVANDKEEEDEEELAEGEEEEEGGHGQDEVPDPEESDNAEGKNAKAAKIDTVEAFADINGPPGPGLRDEINVIDELPVDELPKGGDPILSGNIGGPNVMNVDDEDTRPLSLRRLQSVLPRSVEDIPDATNDRLNFTRLVYNIRPYLVEHYKCQRVKCELDPVTLNKLLNIRQCSKELKRILQLMEERDSWLAERHEKARQKRQREIRFQNTLKGRQLEKKRIEENEFQRLRNKGPPLTSTQIKPNQAGPRQAALGLQRNLSNASTASNVERPLMTLLGKHSQPLTSDYASNEASDGNRNVTLQSEACNMSMILDVPDEKMSFDATFIKPGSSNRGYLKTDVLRVMKDMYNLMQESIRLGQARDKTNETTLKSVDKRLRSMETRMDKMSDQMATLTKAYFDYDLDANQNLIEVENELMQYFPLNELGEKTDFLLTDPECAKTIAKHVKRTFYDDKSNVSELTEAVRKAAMKCFSLELRAHMHVVKRQVKQSYEFAGWHYVKCPDSFQNLVKSYILCLCGTLNSTEKQRGWMARLVDHLRNSGTTYFNYSGTATVTQADYVRNRYYERRRLQDKHFDPVVEGKELKIPTIEQELEHYASQSTKCHENEMDSSNKSQRSSKNDKNNTATPLPDLDTLIDLSKRIKTARMACTVARKGQKRKMALEHHGVDAGEESSSDGMIVCPNKHPGKKLKYAWNCDDLDSSSHDDENVPDEENENERGAHSKSMTVGQNPNSASTSASGRAADGKSKASKLSLKNKRFPHFSQP